ncbi:MAG: chromate efflux transporter [Candidatus Omnitrophica bacterium]|nr:chromate efflux transporter [Candidatus Omnitrophota bacterium]
MEVSVSGRLRELAALFLKLGTISFGGPAAHIALMEEEVVHRRRWLTREHFLDLVGATNLIPGPNSTEMAIHVGFLRGGWPGLIVAGACFILPAALITAGFAWVYVRFGSLPNAAPFLMGIKPVVVAVILTAIWRLGKTAVKTWQLLVIGVIVAATALLGVNEILAFFLGGVGGMCWLSLPHQTRRRHRGNAGVVVASVLGVHGRSWAAIAVAGAAIATQVSLWKLGLFFLKVGSVLYGSGYVLVAFLQGGLVRDYGWLTQQQLLDAIAIGQMTPGPVLSTATCIGYLLAGSAGAVAATVAIFLPSFVFVAMLNPIIPKLRRLRWTSAFLDAVNVSAIALMAAVLIQFARAALADWRAWLIALVAVAVGLRWKLNTAWLILGGGLAGWVLSVLVEH